MPRQPTVTADGTVEAIRDADPPYVTTGVLADHFDVTRQAVRNNRERLSADPRIGTGMISSNMVFFLADSETETPGDDGDADSDDNTTPAESGGLIEALADRLAVASGASLTTLGAIALVVSAMLAGAGAVSPAVVTFGIAVVGLAAGTLVIVAAALAQLALARPLRALVLPRQAKA